MEVLYECVSIYNRHQQQAIVMMVLCSAEDSLAFIVQDVLLGAPLFKHSGRGVANTLPCSTCMGVNNDLQQKETAADAASLFITGWISRVVPDLVWMSLVAGACANTSLHNCASIERQKTDILQLFSSAEKKGPFGQKCW